MNWYLFCVDVSLRDKVCPDGLIPPTNELYVDENYDFLHEN